MGRPRKNNRRDKQLNFSLTADELTTLRSRAAAAGMHLVDYGRTMLLREIWTPHDAMQLQNGAARRLDRLMIVQLRRIGNNLNQIARRLNSTEESAPPELNPLLREIRIALARDAGRDR